MAYNLSERFKSSPKYYRILDPGSYQYPIPPLVKPNKVPFLSKRPRRLTELGTIWTHTIYNADVRTKIPNCSSLRSKVPRFECDVNNLDDIEKILCDCKNVETDTKAGHGICQAKVHRRIFKGPSGSYPFQKVVTPPRDVPFYDARVQESTSFYQGCKWSKWASKRDLKPPESGPGPAAYTIEKGPSLIEVCAEKVRAHKRKTSKQLRLAEIVQRRTLLDNYPGPASYSPTLPQCKDFHHTVSRGQKVGPKICKYNVGPTDYLIQRDFDAKNYGPVSCHAKLLPPAPFGARAERFKPRKEQGASPASYNIHFNACLFSVDTQAPFGTSAKRFTETLIDDNEESDNEEQPQAENAEQQKGSNKCELTWPFKSKTIRMKFPKANNIQFNQTPQTEQLKIRRPIVFQQISPFYSSEGRLRNWFNWIPVHGADETPGPAYYCLEKPKCAPAVYSGPLTRAARFKSYNLQTPPPNQFMPNGIENILKTHNLKLSRNTDKKHKFKWVPPRGLKKLSVEEQEKKLFDESIAILDI